MIRRFSALLPFSIPTGGVRSRHGAVDGGMQDGVRRPISPLTQTSVHAFSILIGSAAIGYFALVGTARLVGAESFGMYSYVLAWITLLGYLSTLGFSVSLLRLVPFYRACGKWPLVGGMMRFATRSAAASGIVVFVLSVPLVLWKYGVHSELGVAFMIGLMGVPLIAMRLVGAAAVSSLGSVIASMIPERLMRDGIALALLGAALLSGIFPADAVTATAAMLLTCIVLIMAVQMITRRIRPERLALERPSFSVRDWTKPTLPLTIIMTADVLMNRSGVLILGLRDNTLDAGIFAVAYSVALLTVLPRMAISRMFAPAVSELYARGDTVGLQALMAQASSLCFVASVVVALPLVAAAPSLLALFGPEFTKGQQVLMLLVAGQLFASAFGPQRHVVTMTGHDWSGAAMMGAFACINFVAGFLLAGPFGMLGAAGAVVGSVIAWNIAMAWFVWRKLGLRPGLIAAHQARRRNALADTERH